MKKIALLLCFLLLFSMMAACGASESASVAGIVSSSGGTASEAASSSAQSSSAAAPTSAPQGSAADYAAVIEQARNPELNEIELYNIVTSPSDANHELIFYDGSLFVQEDMQRYAVCSPGIITIAYAVAIILPKAGREAAVVDNINAFVQSQQDAMQNYLQDQYEITKAALVETMPTGEVVLVMCEDAATVMQNIKDGLAA